MKKINKAIMVEITCTIPIILYGIATVLSDIGVIPFNVFSSDLYPTLFITLYFLMKVNKSNKEN